MVLALLTSSLEGSDELVKKKLTSSYHNFEVINKLIVVQASLGGVSGNYIFDYIVGERSEEVSRRLTTYQKSHFK